VRARVVLPVLIAVSIALTQTPSQSATPPKAGATCSKAGAKSIYQGKKYTCIKSGKKLVWNKGVAVAKTQPTPTPSTTQSATKSPQAGQSCNQPLTRFGSNLICWQIQSPADLWQWTAYSPSLHTPFSLPKTVSWSKFDAIPVGGDPNQLQGARDGIAKLSQELNHYWIEVDVEGGKTVAAAVWAPKSGTGLPVLIYLHGTSGLMYPDLEFAAQVAKKGYVTLVPLWWGPRPISVERFFPKANQTLFENIKGPIFIGANLETARMLLPVLKAATEQASVNPSKLAISGNSRGGTLALHIAATTPEVKAVVPIVPPFLPPQMNNFNFLVGGWETLPKSIVKELQQPTLVIADPDDETVPPASTRDYLDSAVTNGRNNIQSVWIEGKHQLTYEYNPEHQKKTLQALADFLSIHLK